MRDEALHAMCRAPAKATELLTTFAAQLFASGSNDAFKKELISANKSITGINDSQTDSGVYLFDELVDLSRDEAYTHSIKAALGYVVTEFTRITLKNTMAAIDQNPDHAEECIEDFVSGLRASKNSRNDLVRQAIIHFYKEETGITRPGNNYEQNGFTMLPNSALESTAQVLNINLLHYANGAHERPESKKMAPEFRTIKSSVTDSTSGEFYAGTLCERAVIPARAKSVPGVYDDSQPQAALQMGRVPRRKMQIPRIQHENPQAEERAKYALKAFGY